MNTHKTIGNFINGEWSVGSLKTIANLNPATEQSLGDVVVSTKAEVDAAVAAAKAAFPAWKKTPAPKRGDILFAAAAEMKRRKDELARAMHEGAETADVIIMAAAVADYRPAEVQSGKIKKEHQGDTLDLRLVRNPDILTELSGVKKPGQVIIGFAAETEQDRDALLELGRAKILRKGADLLVLNTVGWTEGFSSADNTVVVIDRAGDIVGEAAGNKLTVAERILDLLP